jgi:ribosomal protein S19
MDSKNIIDRIPFHNDNMMYKKCLLLQQICTQSREEKIGRGKKATTIIIPKYVIDKQVLDKINTSVEFYKNLMNKKKTTIKLRPYQESISTQAAKMIVLDGFVYLAMEVRTGKTFTSLCTAQKLSCKNVLFVTKKKAISSIESDYNLLMPSYEIEVVNYESIHKVESLERFDLIILDEAHSMGAFPKPSNRAKQVKEIIKKHNPYVILLSGTPTPESYSQFYHQVYGINKNPFASFKNFYRFCDTYVDVTERKINGLLIKDYSKGRDLIAEAMKPHTISYSQKEAGFKVDTREHTVYIPMSKLTYRLTSELKKKLVIEGKEEVILADTPVKLMMKLHQMYSGTVKFESGNSTILDLSKAEYIYDNFGLAKVGIFYKFKEELNALKKVYGDSLCTELSEFDDTNKSIALQIVSGREGISLRKAEALVYYNIDFSATSYWQSRDRMTTKDRLESDVYWIFSEGGIEKDIYQAVSKKKDYTLNHFKKLL